MFIVGDCEHTVGDRHCVECWAGYPKKCQCQGLIHAQFISNIAEGEPITYSCDNCGSEYKLYKPKAEGKAARRKPKWKRNR